MIADKHGTPDAAPKGFEHFSEGISLALEGAEGGAQGGGTLGGLIGGALGYKLALVQFMAAFDTTISPHSSEGS